MQNNFTRQKWQSIKIPRSSYLLHQLRRHWMRTTMVLIIGSAIVRNDLSVDLRFSSPEKEKKALISFWPGIPKIFASQKEKDPPQNTGEITNISQISGNEAQPEIQTVPTAMPVATKDAPAANVSKPQKNVSQMTSSASKTDDNLANTYSNLGFDDGPADAARAAKRKKQLAYVKRYAKVAQTEMEKFGIPASIKLAQGLLESNVGESRLAVHNNNHFGMKCFSRTCRKGHCSNFTDDSHKDFFRKYKNVWESYRSHSMLLQSSRYKHLKKLKSTDYKGWAYGLKKAGYATDKNYAPKIIGLIEDLKLYQYDK